MWYLILSIPDLCTLTYFQRIPFFTKIIDFTTAGDCDCVVAVERLPALPYSVDLVFLSFGIIGFIVELYTIRGSLMMPKWPKLASLVQKKYAHSSFSSLVLCLLSKDTLLRAYLTSLQLVTGTMWRRQNVSLSFIIV